MSKDKPDASAKSAPAPAPAPAKESGYRVLARKYRPDSFEALIGQDAMVTTLKNAFATGRIAQSYMLTGVRGVGKTTTARLIARALNYLPRDHDPNAPDPGPSMALSGDGVHCAAIAASAHVDVIEMDAASNTGIGDVREIIESARYRPVSARMKVYIIDEVHMLSTQAFNGLLKTLEEPPEHVKFIFATTEIRKVPVTVLSRCQRFDLRRVEPEALSGHLRAVAKQEGVRVEDGALAQIVRASEGSVRDALSLLDQAISSCGNEVGASAVADMLGIADRGRIIDLFADIMKGDAAASLRQLKDQFSHGADPATILRDLGEFTHLVTRLKLVGEAAKDPGLSEDEKTRGAEFAANLAIPVLTRAWQMLLKGISEVRMSPDPWTAADMVIVRLTHAAGLPSPEELIRAAGDAPGNSAGPGHGGAEPAGGNAGGNASADAPRQLQRPAPADAAPGVSPTAGPGRTAPAMAQGAAAAVARKEDDGGAESEDGAAGEPAALPQSFDDVLALARKRRDVMLVNALERNVRLVRFRPGKIDISLEPGASGQLANELGRKLTQWTGERWMVALSSDAGEETVAHRKQAAEAALMAEVRRDPLVRAVLETFPGASIRNVKDGFELDGADGEDSSGEEGAGKEDAQPLTLADEVTDDMTDERGDAD